MEIIYFLDAQEAKWSNQRGAWSKAGHALHGRAAVVAGVVRGVANILPFAQ
jgi:hypothetical protein